MPTSPRGASPACPFQTLRLVAAIEIFDHRMAALAKTSAGSPFDPDVRLGSQRRGPCYEDRFNLGLERLRIEWLDDIIVDASAPRGDDMLGLGFARDHDEQRSFQILIAPHFAKKVVAGHRLHIPIRDHQAVALAPHLLQGSGAVFGIVDIGEANLSQQRPHDVDHRRGIVDYKHWY